MTATDTIAYFSMEIALESQLPTYAGGLGALAGDTLRSAADLGLPMVGVTLLHRKGYFYQRLDAEGRQQEEPVAWSPDDWLRAARRDLLSRDRRAAGAGARLAIRARGRRRRRRSAGVPARYRRARQ